MRNKVILPVKMGYLRKIFKWIRHIKTMAIESNAIMIFGIPIMYIVVFAVLVMLVLYLLYRTKKKGMKPKELQDH